MQTIPSLAALCAAHKRAPFDFAELCTGAPGQSRYPVVQPHVWETLGSPDCESAHKR